MRRFLNTKYALIGVPLFAAAIVAAAVLVGASTGASGATNATAKYYPPLIDNWQVGGPNAQNSSGWQQYGVTDAYGGGDTDVYPQLRPSDIIPAMKDTITFLDSGMSLEGKSKFIGGVAWRRAYGHKKMPKSNTRVANPTSQHPYWLAQMVNEGYTPSWIFWVSGPSESCFTVIAQGEYRKKVKRNGRTRYVWAPIPHAKAQTATKVCLPQSGGTTTTTG